MAWYPTPLANLRTHMPSFVGPAAAAPTPRVLRSSARDATSTSGSDTGNI